MVADDLDRVEHPDAGPLPERQPQTPAEDLLSQQVRLQRPDGRDDVDVLDVPALLEHGHADDRPDLAAVVLQRVELAEYLIRLVARHKQHLVGVREQVRAGEHVPDPCGLVDLLRDDEHHRADVGLLRLVAVRPHRGVLRVQQRDTVRHLRP